MPYLLPLIALSLVITACTPAAPEETLKEVSAVKDVLIETPKLEIDPVVIEPEVIEELITEVVIEPEPVPEVIEEVVVEIPEPIVEPVIEEEEPPLSLEETEAYQAEQAEAIEAQAVVEAVVAEQAEALVELGNYSFVGIDAGHDASGNVRVLEMGDDVILEFQGNFTTSPGPDLYVYISQPQTFGPKSKKGADVSRMQLISALTSNNGAQMYKISKADWEAYGHSIVIWCRAYGYLFGYAPTN